VVLWRGRVLVLIIVIGVVGVVVVHKDKNKDKYEVAFDRGMVFTVKEGGESLSIHLVPCHICGSGVMFTEDEYRQWEEERHKEQYERGLVCRSCAAINSVAGTFIPFLTTSHLGALKEKFKLGLEGDSELIAEARSHMDDGDLERMMRGMGVADREFFVRMGKVAARVDEGVVEDDGDE